MIRKTCYSLCLIRELFITDDNSEKYPNPKELLEYKKVKGIGKLDRIKSGS